MSSKHVYQNSKHFGSRGQIGSRMSLARAQGVDSEAVEDVSYLLWKFSVAVLSNRLLDNFRKQRSTPPSFAREREDRISAHNLHGIRGLNRGISSEPDAFAGLGRRWKKLLALLTLKFREAGHCMLVRPAINNEKRCNLPAQLRLSHESIICRKV